MTNGEWKQKSYSLLSRIEGKISKDELNELKELIYEMKDFNDQQEIKEELKKSRDELKLYHEKYRDLFDFSPVSYVQLNEQGVIVNINLTGVDLFYISRKNLIDLNFYTLIHPQDQSEYKKRFKKVIKEESSDKWEMRIIRADGMERFVLFDCRYVKNIYEEGVGVRAVLMDNTQQVHSKKQLSELKKMEAFCLGGPVVLYRSEIKEGFDFQWVSKTIKEYYGYNPSDIMKGKVNYRSMIHPYDRENVFNFIHSFIESPEQNRTYIDYRILKKGGDPSWVRDYRNKIYDKNDQLTFLDGYLINIDEYKILTDELQQSRDKWELLITNLPDYMTLIDSDYNITYINREFPGLDKKSILENNSLDFVHPEYREIVRQDLEKLFIGERIENTVKMQTPTGKDIWWHYIGSGLKIRNIIKYGILIGRDITDRIVLNNELEYQKEFLKEVIQNLPSILYVMDVEGNVQLTNHLMSEYTGITEELILGMRLEVGEPNEEIKEAIIAENKQVINEKRTLVVPERVIYDKEGNQKNFRLTKIPISTSHGEKSQVLVIGEDITELKEAEKNLEIRLEIERLNSVITANFINIRYSEINKEINNFLGLIGQYSGVDRIHIVRFPQSADQQNEVYEWVREGFKSDKRFRKMMDFTKFEFIMSRLKDKQPVSIPDLDMFAEIAPNEYHVLSQQEIGSTIVYPLYIQNELIGCVDFEWIGRFMENQPIQIVILEYIAEVSVGALQRKNDLYKIELLANMVESTDDAITVIDIQGNIKTWNKGAQNLFGYQREEMLGENINTIVPEHKRQESADLISQIIDLTESIHIETLRMRRDGSHIHVALTLSPVLDQQNRLIAISVVYRDISERIKMNIELEELLSKLQVSNHDLEQFAYLASHDLKEPLRSINGFIRLLKENYSDVLDQRAQEYIDFALVGSQRLQEMIEGLLQYARIDIKGRPFGEVNLNNILEVVIHELNPLFEETHTNLQYSNLPTVKGDSIQLTSLFRNIIQNAVKYSSPDRNPEIKIKSVVRDNKIFLSISDNGIGIPEDMRDQIFWMFRRLHTQDEYNGNGIGLAIAKKIVERHGGEIWVKSNEDYGSTFCFTLIPA